MSLSPPSPKDSELQIESGGHFSERARNQFPASAWADSSAGMIPSILASHSRRRDGRIIADGSVLRAMPVGQPGVLGTDSRNNPAPAETECVVAICPSGVCSTYE